MSGLLSRMVASRVSLMPRELTEVVTISLATTGERSSLGLTRSWAATFMCTSPPSISTSCSPACAMPDSRRSRAIG